MQVNPIQALPPASLGDRRSSPPGTAPFQAEPPTPPKPFVPAPAIRPTLQDNIDIVNALMLMRQV